MLWWATSGRAQSQPLSGARTESTSWASPSRRTPPPATNHTARRARCTPGGRNASTVAAANRTATDAANVVRP
ncbi:MAG: hypothetical protein QOI56_889 [Actinomycetota bacterium]|nr:hypothetical protein [Actinomycetota bacterium]